jgi:hypothetical protein
MSREFAPVQMPPALTVPADAILDSGLKKKVFVDRGNAILPIDPDGPGRWIVYNAFKMKTGV